MSNKLSHTGLAINLKCVYSDRTPSQIEEHLYVYGTVSPEKSHLTEWGRQREEGNQASLLLLMDNPFSQSLDSVCWQILVSSQSEGCWCFNPILFPNPFSLSSHFPTCSHFLKSLISCAQSWGSIDTTTQPAFPTPPSLSDSTPGTYLGSLTRCCIYSLRWTRSHLLMAKISCVYNFFFFYFLDGFTTPWTLEV